jgi:hypothetical protein
MLHTRARARTITIVALFSKILSGTSVGPSQKLARVTCWYEIKRIMCDVWIIVACGMMLRVS